MDLTTIVLLILAFLAASISCGAAVVSYAYSRKPASIELQSTVDELMGVVDKFAKDFRKEKMSRVRQATKESSINPIENPEGVTMHEGQNVRRSKAELRALMKARM